MRKKTASVYGKSFYVKGKKKKKKKNFKIKPTKRNLISHRQLTKFGKKLIFIKQFC